jgi:hypothetical protein
MADFASEFKSGPLGSKITPNGDALKRKIDSTRDTFLKGISSTKHGKKEDPTYLHFKFIFDFGNTTFIDPETFLAPSPLFRPMNNLKKNKDGDAQSNNDQDIVNFAGDSRGIQAKGGVTDSNYVNQLSEVDSQNPGNFYTDMDFFYGSKFKVASRYQQGAYNINGGGVAYYGAQEFLYQRSVKRQQMLGAFRKGLMFINEKCPYYFQTLTGLDQLLKVDIKNLHKAGSKAQRSGTLSIDCLESIDMRIFSLSELYRKATFDYTYHRTMLPENLRKFRMWIVVSEIRNIQLTYGINDVLNPFSIPSVAQAANSLDSFNTQTGLLDNAQGLLQKSTNPLAPEDKFGAYTLGPYAFIYQLDQCEFDFDDSYPSFSSIDNKGGAAVTNKFKIHVGRVKDYKIQFNELADVIGKSDNIKSMVLSDVWGSSAGSYNDYDYTGSAGITGEDLSTKANPKEYFAQMASNFITNTVADLKNQGVSILEKALLGNIYGMGGLNVGASTSSAQSLINTLKGGIPNPFADNKPQSKGLGGPSQRQYPTLKEDVYPNNPGSDQQNLGNTYGSAPNGPSNSNLGDTYPGVPENSQYPKPGGDEYKDVPGKDLGVPGRVYNSISEDIYPTVPETPQYPKPGGDEYKDVPGKDLGVPNRIYPNVSDDVYPTVPEAPQYPKVNDDVYPPDSTVTTNTIGKTYGDQNNSYPPVNTKEYPNPQAKPNPVMDDVYPADNTNYPPVLDGKQYKDQDPKVPSPMGDAYKNGDGVNNYPKNNERVYKDNQFYTVGANMGDVYPTVPGSDLGAPVRSYNSVNDTEYNPVAPVKISNLGRTYPSNKNENN